MISSTLLLQLTSLYLFIMGLVLIFLRRNTLVILLGIELLLNSANLLLVTYSKMHHVLDGQLQVFFVITIAAAESAIGLSIVVNLFRNFGSVKTSQTKTLLG